MHELEVGVGVVSGWDLGVLDLTLSLGFESSTRGIVDPSMDVYLVPVGPQRYELYCEIPDEPETPTG